ncbi:MAG: efflux RND transporter periplasmic adaptor subunit [Thermodesulfobacteriota bacterium]
MKGKEILRRLLPLVIIAAGVFGAWWLIANRPRAQREQVETIPPLVRVVEATQSSEPVTVIAMGTVVPAKRVVLQPEVSGRIVAQSPQLQPGGLFKAGDVILRIDPRDYETAVKQQEAAVERARLEVEVEKGRQVIAEREWKLLEEDISLDGASQNLALRRPQQKNARVALEAAESMLEQARLQLERTTVYAPFNAVVQEEFVDEGQLVSPQTQLATLIGTDRFWVQVSVPVDRLQWMAFSDTGKDEAFNVRVVQEVSADTRIELPGRLVRLLGDLDPVGRMARVLVEIEDPLGLKDKKNPERVPLMLGAYVRVEIKGRRAEEVFRVPRTAIREGDQVWIANEEDRLEVRPVEVFWRSKETVLIRHGLREGDRVVTNSIPLPIPNMKLRVEGT